ncbi:MAG: tRNA (adenosine(37)-N6)-threonylcarbamoyltransferase complex ATPase subunit type 1 TsaE [Flavobacteriales bacterium]|nr:tRNA (adenosine(37)-N6)-threonylcarbamoyltransferase complex ATPase subunit type 1 TsaE [Flavobacteriales bacterium]|tara:strand:+ start:463 stop:891 length:429 start_codon:yes stop_codon:yes gene_type:complete
MTKKFIVKNINDLDEVSSKILKFNNQYKKFAFFGDMGVGKTTLIKFLLKKLGVNDNVTSPTFSIVNEYLSEKLGSIFHFDFYRIKNEKEAYDIGIDEYLSSDNYCFIEWPNKINSFIDDNFVNVYIDIVDDNKRNIMINYKK